MNYNNNYSQLLTTTYTFIVAGTVDDNIKNDDDAKMLFAVAIVPETIPASENEKCLNINSAHCCSTFER